jgi:hypothetical protein
MSKQGVDNRVVRSRAYDPITRDGLPQPHVKDRTARHQAAPGDAHVRAEVLNGTEPVLPEGLTRPPKGPLDPRTDRRGDG